MAYGDEEDHAFCFVGVSTATIESWAGGPLILDDSPEAKFPFSASCNVAYENGKVTFLECVLPENNGFGCDSNDKTRENYKKKTRWNA